MTATIPSAHLATWLGTKMTPPTPSTPALTTLASSTPTSAAPGNPRRNVASMIFATSLTLLMTRRSGRATNSLADLSQSALWMEISNFLAALAGARRASALRAAVMPLATCLGPWMTPPSGGQTTLCAAASSEQPTKRNQPRE